MDEDCDATVDEGPSDELHDMTRRFWIGAALSAPLVVIAMGGIVFPGVGWVELLLAAPVVLWAGWPFFERMAASIAYRSPNMFTLIGLGTATAFAFSVVAVIAPGWFPPSARDHAGQVPRYFEAASVITVATRGLQCRVCRDMCHRQKCVIARVAGGGSGGVSYAFLRTGPHGQTSRQGGHPPGYT